MQVAYLEIVTPNVDAVCAAYERAVGVVFSEPQPQFGGARCAALTDGGRMGVRAPMHPSEAPTTRPYYVVEDVDAATSEAEAAGATVLHAPFDIPGECRFAVLLLGENQFGFWRAVSHAAD